ncbi:MAG TPA: hypothetical protein VK136_07540 [Bacillota bacterium]|nr:hypothetical protein [Bacillota bacterium]
MSKQHSLLPLKVLLFSFYVRNTIIVGYLPLYLLKRIYHLLPYGKDIPPTS